MRHLKQNFADKYVTESLFFNVRHILVVYELRPFLIYGYLSFINKRFCAFLALQQMGCYFKNQ